MLIFADGSAEKHPTVGGTAGYGVYSERGMAISAHVPIDQRQTNRTAGLSSIGGLQATDATDVGGHVHLGATGAARRWKVRGWVGPAGTRVSNGTLRVELLVELDNPGRTIVWVEIPSHVWY